MDEKDPFRHHPELRGKIKPAGQSYFRDFEVEQLKARMTEAGMPEDWVTPTEQREARRREWLKERWDDDLWVFGYGSLMWDPALEFSEVRKARSNDYQRSFCLRDSGARGSAEAPGLMLGIDEGGSCEGLAFRIDASKLDHETHVLFRREMIGPAYCPTWLVLDTEHGPVEALGFVVDRTYEIFTPDVPQDVQAEIISVARGVLGTNFDYLSDTHAQLKLLGISDSYVESLFQAVCALRAAREDQQTFSDSAASAP